MPKPGGPRVTAGRLARFHQTTARWPHTIAARDGSWSTGTLPPTLTGYVTFDEPGMFLYDCTDHPWAIGEITVEEP